LKIEAHHALDKGKASNVPSSPFNDSNKSMSSWMHRRDDCSHVISEINPKGYARSRKFQGNEEVKEPTKEWLLHRMENMGFNFYVICRFMTVDSMDFGQHVLFWIHEY
jgi:hypothetical protein